jgi:hypothetical protein
MELQLLMIIRAVGLVEDNKRNFPVLKYGDFVRVHRRVTGDWRKATKLKKKAYMVQWFYELYRVAHISKSVETKAPHYILFDPETGADVPRRFLRQDLLKIDKDQLIQELSDGHFVVEKVLDRKKEKDGIRYLVRWSGYPESYDTWQKPEPSFYFLCNIPNGK